MTLSTSTAITQLYRLELKQLLGKCESDDVDNEFLSDLTDSDVAPGITKGCGVAHSAGRYPASAPADGLQGRLMSNS